MTEKLTTKAQVKTLAGISDTSKDTAIDTYLPVAEAAAIAITNNSWDCVVEVDYDNGGTELTVKRIAVFTGSRSWYSSGYEWRSPDDSTYKVNRLFEVGNVVDGDDIVARSVISSISGDVITIDNATTAAGSDEEIRINVADAGLKAILAQMVLFNADNFDGSYQVDLDSETVGTYSYSRGDEAIGGSGYPEKFTKALARYSKPAYA
jgi:hypothetical protein